MKSKKYTILPIVIIFFLLVLVIIKIIIDDEYKALHSLKYYQSKTKSTITIDDNLITTNNLEVQSERKKVGIIIYGAEGVNRNAYIPLMTKLSDNGYECFLPTSYGNIPFLNVDGANSIIQNNDDIDCWVIAGHSLGAETAAKFAAGHTELSGIVMLGGKTETDLSEMEIKVLSVLGTLDSVLDEEENRASQVYLPKEYLCCYIKGGNHSYFADTELMYGDTEASISIEQQIEEAVTYIKSFISGL